jgi:hypothetical protein
VNNIRVPETDRIVLVCSAEDWLLGWIKIWFSSTAFLDSSTDVPCTTLPIRRHIWGNLWPSFGPRRWLILDSIWLHPVMVYPPMLVFHNFFTYILIIQKLKLSCFLSFLHLFLETRICVFLSVNLSIFYMVSQDYFALQEKWICSSHKPVRSRLGFVSSIRLFEYSPTHLFLVQSIVALGHGFSLVQIASQEELLSVETSVNVGCRSSNVQNHFPTNWLSSFGCVKQIP